MISTRVGKFQDSGARSLGEAPSPLQTQVRKRQHHARCALLTLSEYASVGSIAGSVVSIARELGQARTSL